MRTRFKSFFFQASCLAFGWDSSSLILAVKSELWGGWDESLSGEPDLWLLTTGGACREKISLCFELWFGWIDWSNPSLQLSKLIYLFFLIPFCSLGSARQNFLMVKNKCIDVSSVARCYPKLCTICNLGRWGFACGVSVLEWLLLSMQYLKSLLLLLLLVTKAQNPTLKKMQKSSPVPPSLLIVMFTL